MSLASIHRVPTNMPQSPNENEIFSTPPSTPRDFLAMNTSGTEPDIRPSLTRKSSRPLSSLHIAHFATGDIELDQNSPSPRPPQSAPATHPNRNSVTALPQQPAENPQTSPSAASSSSDSPFHVANSLNSPYFVHSNLENGNGLGNLLKPQNGNGLFADLGVSKSLQSPMIEYYKPRRLQHPQDGDAYEDDDDDESSVSLTKHLAETAVGVREMSKQLGRARIKSNIQSILIVTKARDNRLIKLTRELALYLMLKKGQSGRGPIVYVDHQLRTSRRFDAAGIERDHPDLFVPFPRKRSSSSNSVASLSTLSSISSSDYFNNNEEGQLRYWTSDMCSRSPHLFDFVVTLGGDGTVLFTSWLFQRIVPPVLPFALGSLGFLTNFDFADHASVMDNVLDNGIRVNLRMRFTCTVYRAVRGPDGERKRKAVKKGDTGEIMMRNVEKGGWEALEGGTMHEHRPAKDKEIMCFTTRPVESFEVLNDLVIDRGPSPYVSMLELFGDEHHMTTVQGDGLTISTPTGSTAYSLSAGGSLVHPEIPAILITPIAPHTLSFRPMLLPDSMEVRVCVPFNSRSTAWVSFDGRGRVELKQGDHIKVTASKYPFPTVCHDKQSTDWFHAISRTLKWNDRERQKSFVVVEEGPEKKKNAPVDANARGNGWEDDLSGQDEEDENDEEDPEEEKFDIDDLSTENKPEENVTQVDVVRSTSAQTLNMAHAKALEQHDDADAAHRAAEALLSGRPIPGGLQRSGLHSGVDSPNRYIAGSPPHLPSAQHPQSARHVHFPHQPAPRPHLGAHAPSNGGGPLRDDARTPTAAEHRHRSRSRGRARVESNPAPQPRAFAVFGADESDSAPSDTES